MFILGLTGSVGMGKSTTAKFFAEEGVPVHDADAAVHRLYEGEAVAPIEAAFPGTTANGKVDRDKLAASVVGNVEALKRLEAIVHPLVRAAEQKFLANAEASGAKVVAARYSAAVRNRRRIPMRCGGGGHSAGRRPARPRPGARHQRRAA